MIYFEEMLDKFGFQDGRIVPSEANTARQIYLLVINQLAERYGSQVRAVPFSHMFHNPCRILFINKDDIPTEIVQEISRGFRDGRLIDFDTIFDQWFDLSNIPAVEPDEAMNDALERIDDLEAGGELDCFYRTTTTILYQELKDLWDSQK